eukprot:2519192-Amphidinium_carterae.1
MDNTIIRLEETYRRANREEGMLLNAAIPRTTPQALAEEKTLLRRTNTRQDLSTQRGKPQKRSTGMRT